MINRIKDFDTFKRISFGNVQFWLLGIAAGLIAIHVTLAWRTNSYNLLAGSLVFWLAVAHLIWTKRCILNFKTGLVSSIVGILLLGLTLFKTPAIVGGSYLHLYPFGAGISLALLASGFRGLKQYWQELILLFFLGVPEALVPSLIDISELSARFSTALLWYAGFNVVRQGTNIYLPGGGIEVYYGCAGLDSMLQVLSIAVLLLVLLPVRWHWSQIVGLPLLALVIGFMVNGIRVALMAVLTAANQKATFDYWHTGDGSFMFSAVAVLLFVFLCVGLLRRSLTVSPARKEAESR